MHENSPLTLPVDMLAKISADPQWRLKSNSALLDIYNTLLDNSDWKQIESWDCNVLILSNSNAAPNMCLKSSVYFTNYISLSSNELFGRYFSDLISRTADKVVVESMLKDISLGLSTHAILPLIRGSDTSGAGSEADVLLSSIHAFPIIPSATSRPPQNLTKKSSLESNNRAELYAVYVTTLKETRSPDQLISDKLSTATNSTSSATFQHNISMALKSSDFSSKNPMLSLV